MAASFCTHSMRSRDKFPILFREFLIYGTSMCVGESGDGTTTVTLAARMRAARVTVVVPCVCVCVCVCS